MTRNPIQTLQYQIDEIKKKIHPFLGKLFLLYYVSSFSL